MMDELNHLTRIQGELTGRMTNVEKDVSELRSEFRELREWMHTKFDERDKLDTDNFNAIKLSLSQIKTDSDKQNAFYRGAKWVALGLGGLLIWALDHLESLIQLFKVSKPH